MEKNLGKGDVVRDEFFASGKEIFKTDDFSARKNNGFNYRNI